MACRVFPRLPVLGRGDYSYGIYLYGIPVQQVVRATFPTLEDPILLLLLVLVVLLPLAMLSWHLIEKPVLALRKRYSFVVRARGIEDSEESLVDAPPPPINAKTGRAISFGATN